MYTILIVDDEANLLEVLAVALENMGYGTVTAETAEDIPWTLDGEYDPGAPLVEIEIEENGVTMLL